jgi:acetyl-CoA synthetase
MEGFWAERAEALVSWSRPWDSVYEGDMHKPEFKWFVGGKLNVSYNCLDRHLTDGRRNKAALIWQGEVDDDVRVFTYQMLHTEVCRFANVLRNKGVGKGDRIAIYLPMIPELAIAMLACARLGAIHSVIFAGFSAVSLQNRIHDCEAKVLITADALRRGGKIIPLKVKADDALDRCAWVTTCIVVKRAASANDVPMKPGRDCWWHREMRNSEISASCPAEEMDAEDSLFILYTSGSTGKPKGIVHTSGGYLTYAIHTSRQVFDLQDDDVYWCTADLGWITGHTYVLYGPLGLGATSLMFEGVPTYPGPDRFWQIVEKFKVNIFYTAPTVIRVLMRFGTEPVDIHDLSSLRLLGSVGEPIDSEAWTWYSRNIGKECLSIVDTWWQTETGGIMISPLPSDRNQKPGSAGRPLPGIDAAVFNDEGFPAEANSSGRLVIRQPWPGMFRGVFGDSESFKSTYFSTFPGVYDTGDGARCDKDGQFWIIGRVDDVINVSGHRLGTAEIESALMTHPGIAEAAVVGMPHPVKGQAIYAYVMLHANAVPTAQLLAELDVHVRNEIGPIASPEVIQYASALPKTKSGKIMRRVLRKIAADDFADFGDTSALADPSVISELITGKKLRR